MTRLRAPLEDSAGLGDRGNRYLLVAAVVRFDDTVIAVEGAEDSAHTPRTRVGVELDRDLLAEGFAKMLGPAQRTLDARAADFEQIRPADRGGVIDDRRHRAGHLGDRLEVDATGSGHGEAKGAGTRASEQLDVVHGESETDDGGFDGGTY